MANREIKFRVFVKEYNPSKEAATMVYSERVGGVSVLFRDFEDEPIMQYTGLKDANGFEIYEGDIVSINGNDASYYESGKYCRGVIEFVGAAFKQVFTHDDGKRYFGEIEDCEVVGNIHQHPELLK